MKTFIYTNVRTNALRLTVQAASREAADRKVQRMIDSAEMKGIALPRLAAYEVQELEAR